MSLSHSPFASRLNANYVPSDSEILEIRALLVDPIEEIARIDAQIAEMELALTQLKEKRAFLQEPIDAHKALISPMRLIPQDVLLEIFFACLPSEHNALIDPSEAPLLFGRVSRHWRSVAYATPILWSSIHIPPLNYPDTPPYIFPRCEGILQAWFERSATCPLSVSLGDFTNRVKFSPDVVKYPLAHHILAVSQRLRYLALYGNAELLRPILQLGPADLPLLRTFRIKTLSRTPASTNIFGLPTLEEVALAMHIDPLSLPLRWSKFTKLSIKCDVYWTDDGPEGGLEIDGALDLLRRCPNLEWCELRVTKFSESGLASSLPPIILPQLHTLVLSGQAFQFHKWIDLVAPNLRSLRIGDDSVPPSPSHDRLSVDIDFTRFTSMASLDEFLQSFPTICRLRLAAGSYHPERMFLEDEFMALFCPPHSLCPMLTDIEIVVPPSANVSDPAVLAFIKARMTMPTPLRRFQATLNRLIEFDVMPELQSLISDGLHVTLQYHSESMFQNTFTVRDGLDGPGAFH
ncbi:hypothetical protein C8R45DRAFT_1208222 [Mycena sanguinolenta]|nr:hypothetical protein C8R45DRAFT_1208222 [Mycena sanguinolenta]